MKKLILLFSIIILISSCGLLDQESNLYLKNESGESFYVENMYGNFDYFAAEYNTEISHGSTEVYTLDSHYDFFSGTIFLYFESEPDKMYNLSSGVYRNDKDFYITIYNDKTFYSSAYLDDSTRIDLLEMK